MITEWLSFVPNNSETKLILCSETTMALRTRYYDIYIYCHCFVNGTDQQTDGQSGNHTRTWPINLKAFVVPMISILLFYSLSKYELNSWKKTVYEYIDTAPSTI